MKKGSALSQSARTRSGTQRARSELGINLMRLGLEEEATSSSRQPTTPDYKSDATVNSLRLIDSYKNFVTFKTPTTISSCTRKRRICCGLISKRNCSVHRDLREEVQAASSTSRAGGGLSRSRRFRRAHHGHARPGRAGCDIRVYCGDGQPVGPQAGQLPLGQHACGMR